MRIISKEYSKGRIEDGIDTMLSLDEESFARVVTILSLKKPYLENIDFCYVQDDCEVPDNAIQIGLETERDETGEYIGRSYFGYETFSINEIFYALNKRLEGIDKESTEYKRIAQLLDTRDLEKFKERLIYEGYASKEIIDRAFDILESGEMTRKFLDYDNNKELFSINGQEIPISEYLKLLGKVFGNKVFGRLSDSNMISRNFYIHNLKEYKERYMQIFNAINMDRYVNPTYEFRSFSNQNNRADMVIRKEEEPDWNVSEELKQAVFQDMPKDLTLEEKALYVYCKLCQIFSYDEGYLFKDKLEDEKYDGEFSKEKLEAIKPDSKITCWTFSRVLTKLLNTELGDGIEAVLISKGRNKAHFSVGFYTDKVSAMLDAVNARDFGNDLMRSKNGFSFMGIDIVSDREKCIRKAIEKVYPLVFGRQQVYAYSYMEELRAQEIEEVPCDIEKKFEAFAETMRQNNISGNEAIQTLRFYSDSGFFEEKLELAYIGKRVYEEDKKKYVMMSLIRRGKADEDSAKRDLYLFDTEAIEIIKVDPKSVAEKFKAGEYVWENEDHKIPGIEEEK